MFYFILTIVLVLLVACILLKLYAKLTTGWCKSHTCLVGKTAIITGANTGIGYETALDFAKRGARVILACRDPKKAEEARTKIVKETENTNVGFKLLDLASYDSVRAFAKEVNDTEERLDILVNNAALLGIRNKRSQDGHALLMQVNYFSHFLLTNLLINLLKKSQPSRIVNVASSAAGRAVNFSVSKIDKFVSVMDDYCNSKLCNILFTKELAKKLQGTGVTVYSLHPGLVKTDIFKNARGFLKMFYLVLVSLVGKTAEEGAQTTVHCSVAKGIEICNGEHFVDCQRVDQYFTALDPVLPKKLWKRSAEIVALKSSDSCF